MNLSPRVLRIAASALPFAMAAAMVIGFAAEGLSVRQLARAGVAVLFILPSAYYLYRRSRDLPAPFIYTTVYPRDPPSKKSSMDNMIALGATLLVVFSAIYPWLVVAFQ